MTGDIEQAATSTPAQPTPREHLRDLIDRNAGAIGASLPAGMSQERFGRLLLTAANTNRDLFDCDPNSFLAAGVAAAQLGLEPNDARGLAYLIPWKQGNRKIVNFIIGYKGLMDLARRSGMVSTIQAFPVFKGDAFTYSLGLEPTLRHVPHGGPEDPEDLEFVYAIAKVNGEPQFVVLTRAQVDATMASSPGARTKKSPWTTHYVQMAMKTAIRRLATWLPQTVEMAQAIEYDDRSLELGDLTAPDDAGQIGHQPFDEDNVIDTTEAGDE